MRIAIVDEWPVFALGLTQVLSESGFQAFPTSPRMLQDSGRDGVDGIMLAPEAVPELPIHEAVTKAAAIAPVLLLTQRPDADVRQVGRASGARGIVHRGVRVEVLSEAVRTVVRGGEFFDPCDAVGEDAPAVPGSAVLSLREREVIWHIARGKTNQQIARILKISPHTVDTYIRRVRSKLGVGNKAELACVALRYPATEPTTGRGLN
ncbi:DNA-binding response regulator [Polymorphospora lycopeni]|uniref:Response regulator transcription factor n=1 Tax=Polymorphospora lycopeni TaxID=3140240 RepID=A0ABV5CQE5_9ACTN